jgi:hypothetical protein
VRRDTIREGWCAAYDDDASEVDVNVRVPGASLDFKCPVEKIFIASCVEISPDDGKDILSGFGTLMLRMNDLSILVLLSLLIRRPSG